MKEAEYKGLIEEIKSQLKSKLDNYTLENASFADKSDEEIASLLPDICTRLLYAANLKIGERGIQPFVLRSVVSNKQITITLRNKTGAEREYKKSFSVYSGAEGFFDKLKAEFIATVIGFVTDGIAYTNVKALNKSFAAVVAEAKCPFSISFVISGSTIVDCSDTAIVFGLSVERAIRLGDNQLAVTDIEAANSYDKFCYGAKKDQLIEELKGIQTPVQLIATKLPLFNQFYAYTRKRADKQLRTFCHRKAENLSAVRSGIGYYEDGEIFGVVAKDAEGKMSVQLSPFNIVTGEKVNVDIISKI